MATSNDGLVTLLKLVLVETDECIEWPLARNNHGYGRLTQHLVHVLVLTARRGPRPPDAVSMHSCDNRACINYRHLSWGTPAENSRQMRERGRAPFATMTHCHQGHPLSGDNLRFEEGPNGLVRRRCRACKREYDRARGR